MADALGANLDHPKGKRKAWQMIMQVLRRKQFSTRPGTDKGTPPVLIKHGAPATNTAADCPGQKYAWCLDNDNGDVYLCTAYTNSTTFTWTKLN